MSRVPDVRAPRGTFTITRISTSLLMSRVSGGTPRSAMSPNRI